MSASDVMLANLERELDERRTFQDQIAADAAESGRDMNTQEMELYTRATARMAELEAQITPLREGARIATDSRQRTAQLSASAYSTGRANGAVTGAGQVEYRSAGAYIADLYTARMGDAASQTRLDTYHRSAAHQITTDNPGLIPTKVVEPLINFVDATRPLVTAIGATDLGDGAWSYARITQHTQVGPQAGEKTELPSRVLKVTLTPIAAPTYGGYVNISKQNIARTNPGIVDQVLNDLSGQYAIATEAAAAVDVEAAATAGPTIPTGADALDISKALWTAAGQVYSAAKGQGRVIIAVSPDMLGYIGPFFPAINPANAISSGLTAGAFAQGPMPAIGGMVPVMSAGFPPGTLLVLSSAAVRCFEYRYGNMQVGEPSVWGLQVGYAGDFETVVIEPTGIVQVTVTP